MKGRRLSSSSLFSSLRAVPSHIPKPDYALSGAVPQASSNIYLFKKDEIPYMKESAMLARYILEYTCSKAVPGMTTDELDRIAHDEILRKGAYPSPLNYAGFPKSICTSVNNVACHGIPSPHDVLQEGDLLSVDVSVFYKGYHGDNCLSVIVGEKSSPEAKKLIEVNMLGLDAGIHSCGPGRPFTVIGDAIQRVADQHNYTSVQEFCGHGLGRNLHMSPSILHYRNQEVETLMRPNMIFTIEPIFNMGKRNIGISSEDNWTVFTLDGSLSAQCEHEVLITEHGPEVITVSGF